MIPVKDFEEIMREILSGRYEDSSITIGVLIADGEQDEARQYIINYLDLFDEKSGKYIDFYIPGYYVKESRESEKSWKSYHPNAILRNDMYMQEPLFYLNRTNKAYYFDRSMFNNFINYMENIMRIEYTYNPTLVLVEINKSLCRGELEFQKRVVIELDENNARGLRRSGMLFNNVFDIAKRYTDLDRFGEGVRMYYIKGNAVNNIITALSGDWLEVVGNISGDMTRFRLRN